MIVKCLSLFGCIILVLTCHLEAQNVNKKEIYYSLLNNETIDFYTLIEISGISNISQIKVLKNGSYSLLKSSNNKLVVNYKPNEKFFGFDTLCLVSKKFKFDTLEIVFCVLKIKSANFLADSNDIKPVCENQSVISKKAHDILVYPNPSSNYINILANNLEDSRFEISIYSDLGKVVYTQNIFFKNAGFIQISTNHLNAGIYFLTLKNLTNNNTKITKIIIHK